MDEEKVRDAIKAARSHVEESGAKRVFRPGAGPDYEYDAGEDAVAADRYSAVPWVGRTAHEEEQAREGEWNGLNGGSGI